MENDLISHCVLAILLRHITAFSRLNQGKKQTRCVSYFDKLHGSTFFIDKWFKQTLCVCYYTQTHLSFHDFSHEWSRHYVFADLLTWSGVILVKTNYLSRHSVLSFATRMHKGCFTIWPVNRSYTMFWIIYWAHLEYILLRISYFSRHTVLGNLLRHIWNF